MLIQKYTVNPKVQYNSSNTDYFPEFLMLILLLLLLLLSLGTLYLIIGIDRKKMVTEIFVLQNTP